MTEPLTFRLRNMFACACKEPAEAADRIEKLEDALHTIYKCCDETGNCSVVRRIVRKALEGKDD